MIPLTEKANMNLKKAHGINWAIQAWFVMRCQNYIDCAMVAVKTLYGNAAVAEKRAQCEKCDFMR